MDSKKELKTLKEIELLSATQRYVIKQEAIKWVKEYKEYLDGVIKKERVRGDWAEGFDACLDSVFQMFFNITEEDLK